MHGQEPVDIVKAINAGSLNPVDVNTITTETSTSGKGNSNASFGNDEMIASQARLTAQEMLLSLPGTSWTRMISLLYLNSCFSFRCQRS